MVDMETMGGRPTCETHLGGGWDGEGREAGKAGHKLGCVDHRRQREVLVYCEGLEGKCRPMLTGFVTSREKSDLRCRWTVKVEEPAGIYFSDPLCITQKQSPMQFQLPYRGKLVGPPWFTPPSCPPSNSLHPLSPTYPPASPSRSLSPPLSPTHISSPPPTSQRKKTS